MNMLKRLLRWLSGRRSERGDIEAPIDDDLLDAWLDDGIDASGL